MRFLNFDSRKNAEFNTSPQSSTFSLIEGSRLYSPHDYNIKITLPQIVYDCKKIYLKSLTTPLLLNNVRARSEMNFINIEVAGSVVKKVYIPDAVYTNIQKLLDDLNTAATFLFPTDNFVFSLDTSTGTVKLNSNTNTTVKVQKTNLAYMLGFRDTININTANNCLAPYLYNLCQDLYVNVYLSNISNNNSSNTTGVLSHFRVPITANSYSINYTAANLTFDEYVYISDSTPISYINIMLFDFMGYSLHSNGACLIGTLALDG